MDVPLQHVIGTVALIGLVAAVGIAYQATVSYIEANVYKSQLRQIAENVALNLVEVIGLAQFGEEGHILIKALDLPVSLNEKAYIVRAVAVNETNQGTRHYIQTEFVTRRDIYAMALIPISPNYTYVIINAEGETYSMPWSEEIIPVRGGASGSLRTNTYVYGGVPNFVVWSYKVNSSCVYGGMGTWVPPGGT